MPAQGYDAILYFLSTANVTRREKEEILERLTELKRVLAELGDSPR